MNKNEKYREILWQVQSSRRKKPETDVSLLTRRKEIRMKKRKNLHELRDSMKKIIILAMWESQEKRDRNQNLF